MSLINDALKKAQKQRTGEMPPLASLPSVGGERPADFSPRARKASGAPGGLFLWIGAGAGGVIALVVAGIFLLRDNPSAPAASTPAAASNPAPIVTPPAASAPAVVTLPPATTASTPSQNTFVLPVTPPPAAPVSRQAETRPAPAASVPAPAPVVAAPAAVTPAPVAAGRLEPRALQYIEGIKVAGIRASATDSKVLMNDRVYRVGDIVEHDLGLRLVGITTSSLTFEDDRGARHTRQF